MTTKAEEQKRVYLTPKIWSGIEEEKKKKNQNKINGDCELKRESVHSSSKYERRLSEKD